MMHYLVEIYDKESEEVVACIMEEIDGELTPVRYETFSKAKVQAALIKDKLKPNHYTKIVSIND